MHNTHPSRFGSEHSKQLALFTELDIELWGGGEVMRRRVGEGPGDELVHFGRGDVGGEDHALQPTLLIDENALGRHQVEPRRFVYWQHVDGERLALALLPMWPFVQQRQPKVGRACLAGLQSQV